MIRKLCYFCAMLAGCVCFNSGLGKDEGAWKLPPETARFKPGPGSDFVTANCQLCHSADYISMQPPMNRAAWEATVRKMREKYGAPLPADKVGEIAEYLAKYYGQ
jgi:hypothetical protein